MAYRIRLTESGYRLDEAVSALQKSCRRARTYDAVFWAKELLRSGYAAYCWRRLMVIASEDVGPGDSNVVVLVVALHQSALVTIGKNRPQGEEWLKGELQLVHAIWAICHASKSRVAPEIAMVAEARYGNGERLEVPEHAIDAHTLRGRTQGIRWDRRAGVRHWQEQGRVVEPEVVLEDDQWKQAWDAEWNGRSYPDDEARE